MKIMLKSYAVASAAAILALNTLGASAQDAAAPRHKSKGELAVGKETRAFGGLIAPNARLAGLFDAGGFPIRTKGVQSITRIATGRYCIRPEAASGVNPNSSLVAVSAEYFYSDFNQVMAQWAATSGCPAGQIGVNTLADANVDAIYTFSNAVGFSVLVP